MTYLVEVPVEGGGRLLVQAAEGDLPGGLELAAGRKPGEIVARAAQPLEHALDELRPAVDAIRNRLETMAPDEVAVEFGIVLSAETGVVVAKGSTEVHFTVTLTWKPAEHGPRPAGAATAAGTSAPAVGPGSDPMGSGS
jgi:hypothetical protein